MHVQTRLFLSVDLPADGAWPSGRTLPVKLAEGAASSYFSIPPPSPATKMAPVESAGASGPLPPLRIESLAAPGVGSPLRARILCSVRVRAALTPVPPPPPAQHCATYPAAQPVARRTPLWENHSREAHAARAARPQILLGWGPQEHSGGERPVVAGASAEWAWTVAVHAQAAPAVSSEALRCGSLSAASAQARSDLEALLAAATQRKAEMARETAMLDTRLTHVSKGFDQVVLQMMLHFQELHQASATRAKPPNCARAFPTTQLMQTWPGAPPRAPPRQRACHRARQPDAARWAEQALEARENELLADARAEMMASASTLRARREQLEAQAAEVEQNIALAARVLRMDDVPEMLQLIPHVKRRLALPADTAPPLDTVAGRNREHDPGVKSLRFAADKTLVAAVKGHGSVSLGPRAHEGEPTSPGGAASLVPRPASAARRGAAGGVPGRGRLSLSRAADSPRDRAGGGAERGLGGSAGGAGPGELGSPAWGAGPGSRVRGKDGKTPPPSADGGAGGKPTPTRAENRGGSKGPGTRPGSAEGGDRGAGGGGARAAMHQRFTASSVSKVHRLMASTRPASAGVARRASARSPARTSPGEGSRTGEKAAAQAVRGGAREAGDVAGELGLRDLM